MLTRTIAAAILCIAAHTVIGAEKNYAVLADEWQEAHFAVYSYISVLTTSPDAGARANARDELDQIAQLGSDLAALQLAAAHAMGLRGYRRDPQRALRFYETATRQEHPLALWQFGLLLRYGTVFERDIDRGEQLLLRAAQLGHTAAQVYQIVELERAGDALSLAKANAWRQLQGTRLRSAEGYQDDADVRANEFNYGLAVLSHQFATGEFVTADIDRARQYTERIDSAYRAEAFAGVAEDYASSGYIWKDHVTAKAAFEVAMAADADGWTINNFAWLLATSPNAEVRDGERAIRMMQTLLAIGDRNYAWVDTLAAAYAEVGEFNRAIEYQREAMLSFTSDQPGYDEALRRQQGYAEGRAWRE